MYTIYSEQSWKTGHIGYSHDNGQKFQAIPSSEAVSSQHEHENIGFLEYGSQVRQDCTEQDVNQMLNSSGIETKVIQLCKQNKSIDLKYLKQLKCPIS